MNIVLVNRTQNNIGGQEIIFQHLANGLLRKNHTVSVLTTLEEDQFSILDTVIPKTELIKRRPFFDDYLYKRGTKALISASLADADVVLLNHPLHNLLSMRVLYRARRLQTKVVAVFHGKGASNNRYKRAISSIRRKLFMTAVSRYADACVFLTEEDRVFFTEDAPLFTPKKQTVIPNGIETELFTPSEQKNADIYKVLFVGSLAETKGVGTLLAVADELEETHKGIRFQFAGKGPFEEYIIQRTNCEYLGILDRKTIAQKYKEANLFVLPSFSECFPMSMLEAMSTGLPMVLSDIYGLKTIAAGGAVKFTQPGDVDDLKKAILYWYDNKETAAQDGTVNRTIVTEKYSIEAYAEYFNELMNSL